MSNLDFKIQESIKLIQRGEKLALALNPVDGYYVGFSGGKDSQVLLDLVKKANVKYRAFYSVTTNDPPDNVYFIRQHYSEVTFIHHHPNFYKLIQTKGLPTIFHRWCCEIFKEGAGAGNVVLTGVRHEESKKRSKYPIIDVRSKRQEHQNRNKPYSIEEFENNNHQCIKGKDKIMLYPLLNWTSSDVWYYIAENNLPLNKCYKNSGRVGCMFCPFSSYEQLQFYKTTYPRFYELIRQNLEIYLSKREENKTIENAEQYLAWWETKKSLKEYISKKNKNQLELDL